MKTLYLVRHAKSSWSFRQLDDFNRPLGKRGRKDVTKMGKYLASQYPCPDQIITSSASRAFYTCLHLSDYWGFPEEKIEIEPTLYHADEEEILEVIHSSDQAEILAVFGHNPSFTDLANELTNTHIPNVPTCGIVGITFDVTDWSEIGSKNGELAFFHYPKGL